MSGMFSKQHKYFLNQVQIGLFEPKEESGGDWEKVDKALDSISQKFGSNVVRRATLTER